MKVDVLLGLQWGDEGKGKVVDVLTPKYDVVARFQGEFVLVILLNLKDRSMFFVLSHRAFFKAIKLILSAMA